MGLTSGIQLAPLMVDIKADIKSFKNDMSKAATIGVSEAQKISKELSSVTKVGEGLSKAGSNLTKFVSVPLAGIGMAAGKMAIDFQGSFAKVSTLLDSNIVDFDKYKSNLIQASNDSKVVVEEFSEAVYGSISAGVDQAKAIEFTTNAMKLAKGGFTDGAKAVDVLTTAINGYGLKTEDATRISDLLITTQNLGKTTVDELASSMGEVIPIASSVNFSVDELSTSYAKLTKNGIDTAKSGTYLKSMLSELGKSGSITDKTLRELTGKGFADLKKEGKSTTEILSMINNEAKKNDKSLKDMFGSVEAGSAALTLMNDDGKEYNEMLDDMGNSAGATQEAFNKMDATPAERMKGALNKVKNAGIELGISLVPVFEKVADGIDKLATTFGNLSDEQKENIVKWGGIAMAAGPTLKLISGGINTFVNFKSVIGGVSTALGVFKLGAGAAATATTGVTAAAGTAAGATGLGALATGLGGAVVAAAPFIAAGAAVVGTGYAIHKGLSQEVVPTVDLFADKVTYTSQVVQSEYSSMATNVQANTITISQATQDTVGAYMAMDDETTKALYSQKVNHGIITQEIAKDTIGKFQNMGQTIKDGQKVKYEEMLGEYQTFFNENSALTETRETEILQTITDKYNERQKIVDDTMNRITQIYTKAKEENRKLKNEELVEINKLQTQMRDNAITTLSATEEEAAVIRERMKDYQGRLTAEMASEMIQKANEAKDGEIQAANEKYDGVIKQATRLKEAGLITSDEYNSMIDSAKKAKDEQIKKANEACEGVKNEISKATPGIEDEVNMQTGKIKNAYDRLKDGLSGFFSWLFGQNEAAESSTSNISSKAKGSPHYNGLDYVPYDGYNAVLHKGEKVLTAEENRDLIQNKSNSRNGNTFIFNSPKAIDEVEAARQLRRANRELGVLL
ncbi:MAG: phage tail tape measure protein [Clostridium sp.]